MFYKQSVFDLEDITEMTGLESLKLKKYRNKPKRRINDSRSIKLISDLVIFKSKPQPYLIYIVHPNYHSREGDNPQFCFRIQKAFIHLS